MEKIFNLFLKKELPGDTLILEAYAEIYNIKSSWLLDLKGLTVQKFVDNICDDLENQGYDLSVTPVDEIKSRFMLYDIKVKTPEAYIELQNAKDIAENSLKEFKALGADPQYIAQASSMIDLLETKMKEIA